jgi:hypothetical protein
LAEITDQVTAKYPKYAEVETGPEVGLPFPRRPRIPRFNPDPF